MQTKLRFKISLLTVGTAMAFILFVGCKKTEYPLATTEDVNITGYLEARPDSFSLFREILEVTGSASFLDTYGAYTCFAVTNNGVKRWMDSVGVSSIATADVATLKNLVRFHLLSDTLTTGQFSDGKLKTPTMYGQFLVTGVSFANGKSSYTVNRQASILSSNIKVGNGIIHIIDRMLTPAATTIAKQLEANPAYSIFVQALKETGFYDTLNTVATDTSKLWKTVIAESDGALADSGITSYAALKAQYSQTGNPANPNDSLNMYVAYHIMDGLYFLGDIINYSTLLTHLPQEVISIKLNNQDVIINENEFNGVLEPGVKLIRSLSDNSTTNGVWHSLAGHTMAKYRKPQALYWDVAMFPELMNMPAYFRKASYKFDRPSEADKPIASIDWHWTRFATGLQYFYGGTTSLDLLNVNRDRIALNMGVTNRASWAEFKTPAIIKGRYKVWVCYIQEKNITTDVLINGTLMQRQVNFNTVMPAGTPEERESLGWKTYVNSASPGRHQSRLVGIVDLATTGVQTVRFVCVSGSADNALQLDMIHFIPVDQNQISPRFNTDGTPVY